MTDHAGVPAPRTTGDELPSDLAKPRHAPEDVHLWAGIIVGGALLAVTIALLAIGIVSLA